MAITNEDLARILGNIEATLKANADTATRIEGAVSQLETKVTRRLDDHESRLRTLEIANPEAIAIQVEGHEKRLRALETGAARSGALAGLGSSVVIAAIVEALKRALH
jgi:hypothetical protein